MSKIIELAKKLKALAEQGVGGEKINAQQMLAALCTKHGIDPLALDEEARTEHVFIATAETDTLLVQVIFQVCGCKQRMWQPYGKKYGTRTEVTEAQRLEILARFQIYSRALKQTLKEVKTAFYIKNRIFATDRVPPTEEGPHPEPKPETPEERATRRRLAQLVDGLETTPIYAQLGEGK